MIYSTNEWDTLREVFVGNIDNPNNPTKGKDIHCINYADIDNIDNIKEGYYPKQVIEETHEDLEDLVSTLKSFGVSVKRPKSLDNSNSFSNGHWSTNGYYTYCPRDSVVIIGDTIIESPMALRSRYFETFSFRDDFIDYMIKGSRWVSAPKPLLKDDIYQRDNLSKLTLNEGEPIFDAANILRCNNDILYITQKRFSF